MSKKIHYKTPSILALSLAGVAFTTQHNTVKADEVKDTNDVPNKSVSDDQSLNNQSQSTQESPNKESMKISGTQAYQDPNQISQETETPKTYDAKLDELNNETPSNVSDDVNQTTKQQHETTQASSQATQTLNETSQTSQQTPDKSQETTESTNQNSLENDDQDAKTQDQTSTSNDYTYQGNESASPSNQNFEQKDAKSDVQQTETNRDTSLKSDVYSLQTENKYAQGQTNQASKETYDDNAFTQNDAQNSKTETYYQDTNLNEEKDPSMQGESSDNTDNAQSLTDTSIGQQDSSHNSEPTNDSKDETYNTSSTEDLQQSRQQAQNYNEENQNASNEANPHSQHNSNFSEDINEDVSLQEGVITSDSNSQEDKDSKSTSDQRTQNNDEDALDGNRVATDDVSNNNMHQVDEEVSEQNDNNGLNNELYKQEQLKTNHNFSNQESNKNQPEKSLYNQEQDVHLDNTGHEIDESKEEDVSQTRDEKVANSTPLDEQPENVQSHNNQVEQLSTHNHEANNNLKDDTNLNASETKSNKDLVNEEQTNYNDQLDKNDQKDKLNHSNSENTKQNETRSLSDNHDSSDQSNQFNSEREKYHNINKQTQSEQDANETHETSKDQQASDLNPRSRSLAFDDQQENVQNTYANDNTQVTSRQGNNANNETRVSEQQARPESRTRSTRSISTYNNERNQNTGGISANNSTLPAYKPQVKSDINNYIRTNKFKAPTYEQDIAPYLPKYPYRNGVGRPEGIIVHDTANDNSTLQNEVDYMKNNYNSAFVHGYIDGERIVETSYTDYLSWGAGPTANQRYISIELVHEHGKDRFAKQMNNFADYAATNLQYYGLKPDSAEYDGQGTVWTHDAISRYLGGTDHTDPHGYLRSRGYSYDELYDLINEKYAVKTGQASPAIPEGQQTGLHVDKVNGLGRLNSNGLYTSVYDKNTSRQGKTDNTYSIKKKANLNGQDYYLMSDYNKKNTLGWAKAEHVQYSNTKAATTNNKVYKIRPGEKLYTTPWGSSKQIRGYANPDHTFQASKQQQVNDSVFVYGNVDGETGWVDESHLTDTGITMSDYNGMGKINSDYKGVYDSIYDQTGTKKDSLKSKSFKLSKKASYNKRNFYLMNDYNTNAAKGWILQDDVNARDMSKPVSINKTFNFKSNATVYSVPWASLGQKVAKISGDSSSQFKSSKKVNVKDETYYYGTVGKHKGWVNGHVLKEGSPKVASLSNLKEDFSDQASLGATHLDQPKKLDKDNHKQAYEDSKKDDKQKAHDVNKSSNKDTVISKSDIKPSHFDNKTTKDDYKVKHQNEVKPSIVTSFNDYKTDKTTNHKGSQPSLNTMPETQDNTAPTIQPETMEENKSYNVNKVGQIKALNSGVKPSVHHKSGSSADKHLDKTYTVRKTKVKNGEQYFLLQDNLKKTPIGWCKGEDLELKDVSPETRQQKTYHVKPNNSGLYSVPSGSKKQQIDRLQNVDSPQFKSSKSVNVNNDKYHYGHVNQKLGWMADKDLTEVPDTNAYGVANSNSQGVTGTDSTSNPKTPYEEDYVITNQWGYFFKNLGDKTPAGSLKDHHLTLFAVFEKATFNGEVWYHGALADGTKVWIKAKDLKLDLENIYYSPYSLDEAYNTQTQLNPPPQLHESGRDWEDASEEDIIPRMDTTQLKQDEAQRYQFLRLNKTQFLSAEELNQLLEGQGVLEGQGQAFKQAATDHHINEIYLISHALLETGKGTSELANGGYVDENNQVVTNDESKKFYNMYGIGAEDQDPIRLGLKTAEENGWDSVSKAIIGGAEFISNNYVKQDQNTLYRMRWNPHAPGMHQYATDVKWAEHNAKRMKEYYDQIGRTGKYFDVDLYRV
ncbi:glucosaminidase domain-containing protein [Staphylococcus massiliensis]|uniref:Bifunctional autolysin n=1 Tax=Staphylococcus massiliensis S46 TaxID=1229783 RepID=K9B204_9STAP|nr:glucosaminidase domain-containing protein [Staphylococcus massiliensis]EKU47790.1 bifunctional autolysin precursor [Staphylococcus massiliensis S46]PNZ97107.1 transcriptional regulator [Staphylococcus massiliensis CCUG 55927]